jgi:hypothetical protein
MTRWRCVATALLLALPIEAGNLCLSAMMLDPGPYPAGLFPRLLSVEWSFFHFIGFSAIDPIHKLLGAERTWVVVAFALAYLQTALVIFLIVQAVGRLRVRLHSKSSLADAHQ